MASKKTDKPQPHSAADRLGRSVQSEARELYHRDTRVLDLGLNLDRKAAYRQAPKPEPAFAEAVTQAVRARLPMRADPTSYHDYEELAADYTASVEYLRGATDDVCQLVDTVVDVNCSYSSSGPENASLRRDFWEDYYGAAAKRATASLIPPAVMLSAELEGLLVEAAAMELRKRLDEMLERFGNGVADAFAELQSAELIGRVDWRVPTACDSFYWEDTVLHEHIGEEVTKSEPKDVEFDYDRLRKRVQQEVRKTSKHRHTVRHGLHVKVVGNAQRDSIGEFSEAIPKQIRRVLTSTPEWLADLTELVRGTTRTDIVVARDILVEERHLTEVETREWEEPCYCPLVTVGDYVLTGWGERESHIETARQSYAWLYVLAVVLVLLAAVSMGLARVAHPLWSYAAPVAATLSLVGFIEARRQHAIARGDVVRLGPLVAGGLCWFLLATGLMGFTVGLVTPNWIVALLAGVVTATALALLRRVFRSTARK
jgi:hypothetical protein